MPQNQTKLWFEIVFLRKLQIIIVQSAEAVK